MVRSPLWTRPQDEYSATEKDPLFQAAKKVLEAEEKLESLQEETIPTEIQHLYSYSFPLDYYYNLRDHYEEKLNEYQIMVSDSSEFQEWKEKFEKAVAAFNNILPNYETLDKKVKGEYLQRKQYLLQRGDMARQRDALKAFNEPNFC